MKNLNKENSYVLKNGRLFTKKGFVAKDILIDKKSIMKNGKGWFIAMAISVTLIWAGVNYLFPWH